MREYKRPKENEMKKPTWTWVALALIAAAAFVLTAIYADEDARNWILGLIAAVGAVGPGLLRGRGEEKDEDHDDDDAPPSAGAIPGAGALVVLLVCLPLIGCGATALQRQALVADVTARTVNALTDEARGAYEDAQEEALAEVCGSSAAVALVLGQVPPEASCSRSQAEAAVDPIRAAWVPLWASHEALGAAHQHWVQAIVLANAAGRDQGLSAVRWLELARPVALLYRELGRALRLAGVDVPLLPVALRELVVSGGES